MDRDLLSVRNGLILFLLSFVVVTIVNLAVLKSGPFWDDYVFIFSAKGVVDVPNPWVFWIKGSGHERIWSLGYSQFWALFELFGQRFWAYKLVSLVFHSANGYLLFRLMSRLKFKYAPYGALIFMFHPFHVETLSWIFQLNSVMGFFWSLLTCWMLLNLIDTFREKKSVKKLVLSLLGTTFFYFLSVKTKPVAVLVPFCMLLTLHLGHIKRHWPKILGAFLILLIVGGTIAYLSNNAITESSYENSIRKTYFFDELFGRVNFGPSVTSIDGTLAYHTFWGKMALKLHLIGRNFTFYFFKFFIPVNLLFIYPKWPLISGGGVLSVIFLFLVGCICFYLFFKLKERRKLIPIALVVAGFVPISGVLYIPYMKYSYVADHWAYVLTAGMAWLLIQLLEEAERVLPKSFDLRAVCLIILFLFAAMQSRYGRIFNNTTEMLERNITYAPDSPFPYQYLARLYIEQKMYYEAGIVIDKGLRSAPNDEFLLKLKSELP